MKYKYYQFSYNLDEWEATFELTESGVQLESLTLLAEDAEEITDDNLYWVAVTDFLEREFANEIESLTYRKDSEDINS